MFLKPRTLLMGAGRMGGAILRGWAQAGQFEPAGSVMVVDPREQDDIAQLVKDNFARSRQQVDQETLTKLETLVLAIKPQKFEEVAAELAPILPENVLIVSVVAGISLARLEAAFGAGPHVRAMPNTAAEVGQSISVFCKNDQVEAGHIDRVCAMLQAIGLVEELDDERLMDAVTAVSGSGPAYFFLLVEVLAAAGQTEGLSEELARKLARQTMIGASALLEQRAQSPSELRAEVTSPNGTTAAALDVMMGNGAFAEMLRNAVSAATRRGTQLRNSGKT
jgi:pyrroline-5-carboxylate reductase